MATRFSMRKDAGPAPRLHVEDEDEAILSDFDMEPEYTL